MADKNKVKKLGQIFTPDTIVQRILDEISFTPETLDSTRSRILEPAFGEGAFLYEIIDRLILLSNRNLLTIKETEELVDTNVYGFELDDELFNSTVVELKIFYQNQGYKFSFPNLIQTNALKTDFKDCFDYVVGNPPYIRFKNLDTETQSLLKSLKQSIGTTDLYIGFYELGIQWLRDGGKLGYIAPNSWLRNASQKQFREHLIQEKLLRKVIDFENERVFSNASTYVAITILEKPKPTDEDPTGFTFVNEGTRKHFTKVIPYEKALKTLNNFAFLNDEEERFLVSKTIGETIGDHYKIQNGLATLGDSLFIGDNLDIEPTFVRSIVKGSTFKGTEYREAFFPYKEVNGRFVGLTESELKNYPKAYAYCLRNREAFEKRARDKLSEWFHYGRSQAIQETSKKKLVIPPLVGPKDTTLRTFVVDENVLVYGGLFLTVTGSKELAEVKAIVESEDFCQYVKLLGKDMSGGYKSFTPAIIKGFTITG